MKRVGLTLMELLTVISILATLAALLYPVYLRVRTRTDIMVCADQLRQIGQALKIYAHDHGDDSPYGMPEYPGYLYPNYIGNRAIFVCPTFRKVGAPVVEAVHKLFQQQLGYGTWSTYFYYLPRDLDQAHRRSGSIVWISFAEAYALRGEDIPIALCGVHRYGCPCETTGWGIHGLPEGKQVNFHKLADPSAPLVLLRWSGSVDLIRDEVSDTCAGLLNY